MQILRLFVIDVVIVQKGQFSSQNLTKHFFSAYFSQKVRIKKFNIFEENHHFWKNENFATLFNRCFHSLERLVVFLEHHLRHFPGLLLPKRKRMKKFEIFDQTHGLTPLEKYKFCDFFISMFSQSTQASFYPRTSSNTFSQPILAIKKG